MARNPSDAQRLISELIALADRDEKRHPRGTLQALESGYEHRAVVQLARKVLLNIRAATQSINIGFDLVPDRHLVHLIEQYDAGETQLQALHARLQQARRMQEQRGVNGGR